MPQKICCNPAHPQEQPATASHVLENRVGQPHFLCDPCATILGLLGDQDTFVEPIEEWERERLTLAELLTREAEERGDQLFDQSRAY